MRALLAFLLLPALGASAFAHSFYSYECCGNNDCGPISSSTVRETDTGIQILNGLFIPYGSSKQKWSPDGRYHICITKGKLRCLYVPRRAF